MVEYLTLFEGNQKFWVRRH